MNEPEIQPPPPPPAPTPSDALPGQEPGGGPGGDDAVVALRSRLERAEKLAQEQAQRVGRLELHLQQALDALARRVADLANDVAQDGTAGEVGFPDPRGSVFLARKQTDGTWTEVQPVSGTLTDMSGSNGWRNCSNSAHASALIVTSNPTAGQYTTVLEVPDGSDYRFVELPGQNASAAFVAYLTKIGGSNGDDGTATGTASFCTYTYSAYFDAAKTQLAGGTLTVQAHRMLKVAVTAASLGIIQKNSNNTYSLMNVLDEYWDRDACP